MTLTKVADHLCIFLLQIQEASNHFEYSRNYGEREGYLFINLHRELSIIKIARSLLHSKLPCIPYPPPVWLENDDSYLDQRAVAKLIYKQCTW